MAESTPLPDHELVSAYLDGELTDDERARVEADPRLFELVRRMTPVVAAVRTPVARLDQATADLLIGRALDALPEETVAPTDAVVIDLGARRARRNQLLARVAAVAAGVAVVALAGAAIRAGSNGGSDGTAAVDSAADVATEELSATSRADAGDSDETAAIAAESNLADDAQDGPSSDAAQDEAEASAAPGAAYTPPLLPGLPPDVGQQDPETLAVLVDGNLETLLEAPRVDEGPRCVTLTLEAAGFLVIWWAEAVWEGQPAHVVAWRSPTELIVVVNDGAGADPAQREACSPVFELAR